MPFHTLPADVRKALGIWAVASFGITLIALIQLHLIPRQSVASISPISTVAGVTSRSLLTVGPSNANEIKFIAPGSLINADARFLYIHNKSAAFVPVIAPADGTLVYAAYKNRADLGPKLSAPDYDFEFQINAVSKYRINHVTKPIPALLAAVPVSKPVSTAPGKPLTKAQTSPIKAVAVKAGQRIGTTTGTPGEHNWDFALFVNNTATCPFTHLPKNIQTTWLGLLGKDRKVIKGTACS